METALEGLLAWGLLAAASLFIAAPMLALLGRALFDAQGAFVGLANFATYFASPALTDSAWRSLRLSALSAFITVALAYLYAYALTLTCMPHKGFFRAVALVPLLAPSLLMAISLVYLFGQQGILKPWLGRPIYGELGIVVASVLWTFPHALLILVASLSAIDQRLIEAARMMGASPWEVFRTVMLPASRYGLLMAFVVVFVLVITDFGVPKVIGGQANVLATDLYKQVVGQQNFAMGAVVGAVLLLPAVGAFLIERHLRRRQLATFGARAVPYTPEPWALRDRLAWGYCALVSVALLGVIAMAIYASFVRLWPYDLSLSLRHYDFDNMDGGGWVTYWNSLRMAFGTALVGTVLAFLSAWLVVKPRRYPRVRDGVNLLATLPLAIPGLALGVGYIFFFNHPGNPLSLLYGTMTILVLCTVVHFFAVAHLTLVTALSQLDREFEAVAESLAVPFWQTIRRVHLPVCLPALLEVGGYFFVNAMTTVSAVVFLYAPHTQLASVAVLNMDDAGDIAPAAAMAVLIFATAALVRLAFMAVERWANARAGRWRLRTA
ncbi:MAG: putative 2-aminoethylphosphonate ABC transporter permease subunit [Casimicrobiaceae bacterium]|nr:putative 2-aminoethylphosphonate ABC transporter permease subunit [Casimicrobiaceae bacterium]MDW8312409.1 putative 2-aminoethylphosphonate ABC transporter permease subunit [Burkholderiales bacterium]